MQNRKTHNGGVDCSHAFEELARRLRGGERNVAQAILESVPNSRDPEFEIDLIYREYLVLCEVGENPQIRQFCNQFPKHEARLKRLLEVDREFDNSRGFLPEPTIAGSASDDETIEEQLPGSDRRIGRYRLIHQIGHGGSSRVFKARQIGLDRIVAVKLLNINFGDLQQQRRFQQEAEMIARLQHPNIVQLFDYGCEDGQYFLVLELIEGGGLDERAKDLMTVDEISRLMIKLAHTVQFAHDQNVIHRDLKPSNVLLTPGGEPKIADFGLAKNLEASETANATKTGTTLGTPSYMAPEQVLGSSANIGPVTDVYGLGGILYQLLTARPPFVAENILETLRLVREVDPVAPSQLRPKLHRDLEVICLRC